VEIICTGCSAKFNIPDQKIPKDKKSSFLCPKCKQRIYINKPDSLDTTANADPVPRKTATVAPPPKPQSSTPDYDAAERPFDYLDENAETALICLGDTHTEGHARTALEQMKYHIEVVEDIDTALTRMKYHLFNIIVMDDTFDSEHMGSNRLFQELKELDMTLRRQIVVILISKTLRTQDNMAALHASVNQIINHKEMASNALNLFKKTLKDHGQFYAIFNETLKKIGKG